MKIPQRVLLSPSTGVDGEGRRPSKRTLRFERRARRQPGVLSTSSLRRGARPGGGELLTVDVLDEAGGAGHIVHFELR